MSRTWKQLDAVTGGLSRSTKMPGRSHGIPATRCKLGSKLATVAGSTCASCYALKGRYRIPNVIDANEARFKALRAPGWIDAMVESICKLRVQHFRWFDSGDLQGLWHLRNIVAVALRTERTYHWLPTRELSIVRSYLRRDTFPANMVVRVSASMIDARPPRVALPTSTVHTINAPVGSFVCKAYERGNSCGACRACWDPSVANVSYPQH